MSATPDPAATAPPEADARPVDQALEGLGRSIARLESALSAREEQRVRTAADDASAAEADALRAEYDRLNAEYEQLRAVVGQVDGRLEGTVARLRAMLQG